MNNTLTLWEEKNSIVQSKKFESKVIFGQSDIIKNIETKSNKNECRDIGNTERWIRKCPACDKEIIYNSKRGFDIGIDKNTKCSNCKSRTTQNFVGVKFGKITIIKQYYITNATTLKVDYICECGHTTINRSFQKVKNQRECIKCSTKKNAYKHGNASFNSLYNSYIKGAISRSLKFDLSIEQFKQITTQNCFYCGNPPTAIIRPNVDGAYIYNGIDRKDNTIGYTIENCVSCCKFCNFAKYTQTYNDFLTHIVKIYDHQKMKGNI